MHGFLNQRKPVEHEKKYLFRQQMRSHVEAIGTCRLVLKTDIFKLRTKLLNFLEI